MTVAIIGRRSALGLALAVVMLVTGCGKSTYDDGTPAAVSSLSQVQATPSEGKSPVDRTALELAVLSALRDVPGLKGARYEADSDRVVVTIYTTQTLSETRRRDIEARGQVAADGRRVVVETTDVGLPTLATRG